MKKAEITEDIDYIKDVIEKIRDGKMSFIIGAGFSKNISSKYLSWKELLHDMITEMYEDERQTWHASDDDLINKYGYLGIASEYVRRKGYHEAIDDYISERTPVLVPNSNGKYELKLNDKIMVDQNGESVSVDVSCHKLLLALGAPAIYTFNYDNALDVYQKNIITDEENKKFQKLKLDIDRLKDAREKCKEIINKQTNENSNFSSDGDSYATSQDKVPKVSSISKLNIELKPFDIQLEEDKEGSLQKNQEILNSVINKKKNELSRLQQSLEKKYLIVKNSSKISESGNQRCIFKIHGSIREEWENFGFDEDHHLQYIICQEDYDSYLKKHEAFVDLMRISLMRNSFCIIGFSCDDPNFMLWLNWVKDIMDRSQEVSQNDKLRKFFINVDDSSLPEDKQLLLENHRIEIINLYEVYKNAKNCNERMKLFLRNIQLTIEAERSSAALWNSIHLINQSDKNNKSITYDKETLDHFWETSKLSFPHSSIYSQTGSYVRNDLLYSIPGFIQNHQLSTSIAKILLMGMDEENLPFDKILSNMDLQDKFHSQLKDYKELLPLFDDYEILNNTLSCIGSSDSKPGPCSSKEYIDILNDFYLFNIDSAIDKLKKWKPTDIYSKVVDMVMKCTFSKNATNVQDRDLEPFLDNKQYRSDQEYLSVLQILLYSRPSNIYSRAEDHVYNRILKKINELCGANRNLIKLSDYIDSIITAIKEKEEIKPLGSFSKSFSFSYDEDALSSCKLIVMLAKGGIFTVMNRHSFIKKEDWYQVLTKIYTKYPCACLFYTSLYGDEDLATRVAQLYTFSPDKYIQKTLENILPSILTSASPKLSPDVINTLSRDVINALFIYAQYFIRIVKIDSWQETFKKLFKEQNWIERHNAPYNAVNNFVVQALRYVNDEEFCNLVITQCLAKGTNITNYQNNLIISASSSINNLDSDCLSALKTFMNKVTKPVQTYVIFNLRTYLSAISFHHWMNTLPQELLQDPITLKGCCELKNKKNTNFSLKLSRYILSNQKLWATGIKRLKDNGISVSDSTYLDINSIECFMKISDEHILEIYSKMVVSLNDLHFAIEEKGTNGLFNPWGSLIYSMYVFMDQHSQLLNSQSDFNSNKAKCKELYKIINGEGSILKMLASGDDNKINEAIREMMTGIEIYKIENFGNEYRLLVNIVLLKKTKVLNDVLFILMWTIKKHSHFFKQYHFAPFFHLILHNYALYFIGENCPEWDIEADKDYVERCMMYLNKWLAENDSENEEWKDYQTVFIQPTEFALISKNENSEKRKL
jgi:hypothetical protein